MKIFKQLDTIAKRQIKASMKRIIDSLLTINNNNPNKVDSELVFKVWTSRYLKIEKGNSYFNTVRIDEVLYNDCKEIMASILIKQISKFSAKLKDNTRIPSRQASAAVNIPVRGEPATEKQLSYATYLMNMIHNKPLPSKNYTKSEISTLINNLKKKLSA